MYDVVNGAGIVIARFAVYIDAVLFIDREESAGRFAALIY